MNQFLAAAWVLAVCTAACFAQSPAELEILEGIEKDDVKALATILKAPDEYSAVALFLCASVALREKRLEDSAFLFYAGQLRRRFDEKCFPPKGTGGNSPGVLYAALSQQAGSAINPAIMAEPKIFAKVYERLKKWSPKAPKQYHPGYEFTDRLSEKDARAVAEPNRTDFLSRMGDLVTLLNDAQYFAALRIVQAHNLGTDDERPTEEEYEKAVNVMKRIEKDKQLQGFFSD